MSPCASDSAELPPCRTEQVRHHCLNPGSIPKTSLPPLSPCFTLSPTNLPLWASTAPNTAQLCLCLAPVPSCMSQIKLWFN